MYVLHHADQPDLYAGLPNNPRISPLVEAWKGVSKYAGLAIIGTNDVTTDPDYVLASNVSSCSFVADSEPDPVTHISRVVRVTVTVVVQIGEDTVRLSGSAAPRRSLVY